MNEIKLIIFDLDGTLYNLDDVVAMNYQMQLDFYTSYMGKSKFDAILTFEKNDIYPIMSKKSKSATEFFVQSGIPASEWNSYRESNFDVMAINTENSVKLDVIKRFQDFCPLVLLSSNSSNSINRILNHINICTSCFEDIICSNHKYSKDSFRKIKEMKLLADRYGISTDSILSIGDRYKTDIEPMLKLGGHGVLVDGPAGVNCFSEDFCSGSLTKNKEYAYFGGFK